MKKSVFDKTRESARPVSCAPLLGVIGSSKCASDFSCEFDEPLARVADLFASTVPSIGSESGAVCSFQVGAASCRG